MPHLPFVSCTRATRSHQRRWRRPFAVTVLVGVALLLGAPAPAQATPFCMSDGGGGDFVGSFEGECPTVITQTYSPTMTSNDFIFEDHSFTLMFEGTVLTTFDLTIAALDMAMGTMPVEGFTCLPYGPNPSLPCIFYDATGSPDLPMEGTDYLGTFRVDIAWLLDTNAQFPSPRMFHDPSTVPGGFADITIEGSYIPGPVDPVLGGRTNHFSTFNVAGVPVPEPGSLLLMGIGLGGALYRRARRNVRQDLQAAEPAPRTALRVRGE